MSIGKYGENLIFILSQPRSGSTLLQQMIGTHPDVFTSGESWIMLHPLYALREQGVKADYLSDHAYTGLQHFLEQLPNGEADYLDSIRLMGTYLYEQARQKANTRYYLDKTPHYHFIASELVELFPQAKYIVLFRNPLAVLHSMIRFIQPATIQLQKYASALMYAPSILTNLVKATSNILVVNYEQLVTNPTHWINEIATYLDIPYTEQMLRYNSSKIDGGGLGDTTLIQQYNHPITHSIDKWQQDLSSPQIAHFWGQYLDILGDERLSQMGYSYEELKTIIAPYLPPKWKQRMMMSLEDFLTPPRVREKLLYPFFRRRTAQLLNQL